MRHLFAWLPCVRSIVLVSLAAGGPASAAVHEVLQQDFEFVPAEITVAPGDTVRWIWTGGVHTVTSGSECTHDELYFDQALDAAAPEFEFVIPDGVSEIPYFCRPHCVAFDMTGLITIATDSSDLGDLNCDGVVNGFDIDPFVLALTSGPTYEDYYAVYPDCDHMLADINGDGDVNGFDIDPFVELLIGG